jgi:hypothetical protein
MPAHETWSESMKSLCQLPMRVSLWILATALLAAIPPGRAAGSPPPAPVIRYLSPVPGAGRVLAGTSIIVRFDRALTNTERSRAAGLGVAGSASGKHEGDLTLTADGRTLLFKPRTAFAWGERATVELPPALVQGGGVLAGRTSFSFSIAATPPPELARSLPEELSGMTAAWSPAQQPLLLPSGAIPADTLPASFPPITPSVYSTPSPGRIFLTALNWGASGIPQLLLILDDSGQPVFCRETPGPCLDFKVQPDGRLTYFDWFLNQHYAMDATYTIVDSFTCGNGYTTDSHELRLLPNGHALLMSYDPQAVDMSQIVEGGDPAAVVLGLVIQEIDEEKNVVFQWRSWDHFQITDAWHENLTEPEIDYVHGNAIELDRDGNLMISCRHLEEITKISRETGEVLWRWGGKNNQFTFLGDTLGFSYQHGIRRIANGHITLFDNGNYHVPPFSRAVEYELDEMNRTARLVWQYRETPDIFGFAMGYAQRLGTGNTLISWGAGKPDVTEVTPGGTKVWELRLPDNVFNYRAYRFAWGPQVPEIPAARFLSPNRPNPFRSATELTLKIETKANVSLKVYDVAGREVASVLDGVVFAAGVWPVQLDLGHLNSGLYFCRLVAGGHTDTRRIVLTK